MGSTTAGAPPTGTRRFTAAYLVGHLGWAVPTGAVGTLVPALLAIQQGDAKVGAFATMTALGAVGSVVGTVVGGAASDRTRSRFGRRRPWLLGGSVLGAAGLSLVTATGVFALQVLAFVVFQAGLNAMLAALYALVPERVPAGSLGRVSALAGVGYLVGNGLGSLAGAVLVTTPDTGLAALGWVMALGAAVVCLAVRGPEPAHPAPERVSLLRALAPPADRDFALAFAGRFLVVLALFGVVFFQLYLLTDDVGLDTVAAGRVLAASTVVFGTAALLGAGLGGVLTDRTGRRKPWAALAGVLIGAAVVPLLVSPGVASLVAFAVLGGLGYGVYLAADQALMVGVLARDGEQAKELGILAVANSAPLVLGPPLAGLVVTHAGYPALFAACAATAVVGGVLVLAVRRVR